MNRLRNANILVVNEIGSTRKMLTNILRILGAGSIDEASDKADAFRKFNEKDYTLVISALIDGSQDAIGLAKDIRNNPASRNRIVPIIATTGPNTLHLVDAAREVGITDLLQTPFTVDDMSRHLNYNLSLQQEQLEAAALPQEKPQIDTTKSNDPEGGWPEEEEATSLTKMLLEHYMRHHEIVFMKLKFAQDATQKSIHQLRSTHEKVRHRDNTNIHEFNDFEKMWEEIIQIFLNGGLAEEELFKIEKLVTTIPEDIKKHYNTLSAQDKSFLSLVESLNADAYKKAKNRVTALQKQPNPLHGKTPEEYTTPKETEEENPDAFIFMPKRRK
ncbi:MAG TPA: response regulator [Alphaproteobacteria bacterium]|nr:response regulator [Alphaproteobacteria bacterium]USO05520.1 MAG: response regulator [Rhodospirillales bacterium]HOO82008.1 response regulator [Alphaproteobacteria bacterium]